MRWSRASQSPAAALAGHCGFAADSPAAACAASALSGLPASGPGPAATLLLGGAFCSSGPLSSPSDTVMALASSALRRALLGLGARSARARRALASLGRLAALLCDGRAGRLALLYRSIVSILSLSHALSPPSSSCVFLAPRSWSPAHCGASLGGRWRARLSRLTSWSPVAAAAAATPPLSRPTCALCLRAGTRSLLPTAAPPRSSEEEQQARASARNRLARLRAAPGGGPARAQ